MLVLWILLGLLALGLVAALVAGARLPVSHHASGAVTVAASPDVVHALLVDVARAPSWRPDLRAVELLGHDDAPDAPPARADLDGPDGHPRAGRLRYREIGKNGVIPYEIITSEPGERLVVAIIGDNLPYGGVWTWTLSPAEDHRCHVTLTEDGQIFNVLYRFLARYVFGYTKTIDETLVALAAYFERPTAGPPPSVDPDPI